MEDTGKKVDLSKAVRGVGKSASRLFSNTAKVVVKNIDQNDDGEFNMKDVAIVADSISNAAKSTAISIKESLEEKNHHLYFDGSAEKRCLCKKQG